MSKMERPNGASARNVRRIGHLDLPGAGQVTVAGNHAYVGHIPNKDNLGTSIVDISDPKNPRLVATVTLDDPTSHSHKVRVSGDLMVVNHERNPTPVGRRAEQLPAVRRELREVLGRDATRGELAQKLNVTEADLAAIEAAEKQPYRNGGFRIYDVSDPLKPALIHHQLTGGIGVHRFDMDERYAYISTEMDGFVGNILVIYDLRDTKNPAEVSRWWMPGQHIAAGEKPTWSGKRHRLHHALRFGNEMWASCWHGGFRIVDVADLRKPKTVASYNYHPPFPEPTHTAMPVPVSLGGRRIAVTIDEEDQAQSANEEEARRGRPHAGMSIFDVSDYSAVKPLSLFEVSELDSPFARTPGARFGAHQFHERMAGTLVFAVWFSAGLRVVDLADPSAPREIGFFIPEPAGGRSAPQSNDVVLDQRGLIYVVDRHVGFDVLEFDGGRVA
ncbi:MAG TPA: RNA polymerase subunit sigma-70 [Xanthobacteraceae bacterium]|nr:RNA polymerase subunit sigma-70 [Xanthobacteraceae bacterium]